jgi:hypothetical protein
MQVGGGLLAGKRSTVIVQSSRIESNVVSGIVAGGGGVAVIERGTLRMESTTIERNRAVSEGRCVRLFKEGSVLCASR